MPFLFSNQPKSENFDQKWVEVKFYFYKFSIFLVFLDRHEIDQHLRL
jgi:hypothetical protein